MSPTTQAVARTGTEISAGRLQREIMARYPDNFMMYADVFAMGCLLHLQGQHKAGRKLIDQVRRALPTTGNKTYFADLLDALSGNEARFIGEIQAHLEVNELLELTQRQLSSPAYAGRPAPVGVAQATEVRVGHASVECPHCRTRADDWENDPRGQQRKCGSCWLSFYVAPHATVIID